MTAIRQDAWSPDDDLILAEVTLRHIREGSTQLAAFDEVGERIARTSAACGFRWNSCVRKRYNDAIAIAKQQRQKRSYMKKQTYLAPQVSSIDLEERGSGQQAGAGVSGAATPGVGGFAPKFASVSSVSGVPSGLESFSEDASSIDAVIRFLRSWKNTYQDNQRHIGALERRVQELEEELFTQRGEYDKLSREINSAQTDYLMVNDDYRTLMQIMDRARRLNNLKEEEELKPRFRMDANGNLERID
jgi:prespore-specific regulator